SRFWLRPRKENSRRTPLDGEKPEERIKNGTIDDRPIHVEATQGGYCPVEEVPPMGAGAGAPPPPPTIIFVLSNAGACSKSWREAAIVYFILLFSSRVKVMRSSGTATSFSPNPRNPPTPTITACIFPSLLNTTSLTLP